MRLHLPKQHNISHILKVQKKSCFGEANTDSIHLLPKEGPATGCIYVLHFDHFVALLDSTCWHSSSLPWIPPMFRALWCASLWMGVQVSDSRKVRNKMRNVRPFTQFCPGASTTKNPKKYFLAIIHRSVIRAWRVAWGSPQSGGGQTCDHSTAVEIHHTGWVPRIKSAGTTMTQGLWPVGNTQQQNCGGDMQLMWVWVWFWALSKCLESRIWGFAWWKQDFTVQSHPPNLVEFRQEKDRVEGLGEANHAIKIQ